MITKLNAKEGELVVTGTMNNAGTVILEIGDFSEMLLVARVDEANIAAVKVGQKARIHTQAYGDRVFGGTVETVALAQSGGSTAAQISGSSSGRYFKVEVRVDSGGERLFAGLSADVDIESDHPRQHSQGAQSGCARSCHRRSAYADSRWQTPT